MQRIALGSSLVLAALCGQPVQAQTISVLALEGDPVPGGGTIQSFLQLDVNDEGVVFAVFDADPASGQQFVAAYDGVEVMRRGDAAPGYPGAVYTTVSTQVSLNETGGFSTTMLIDPGGGSLLHVLSLNGYVTLWSGSPVLAPGAPLGSTYDVFRQSWIGTHDTFLTMADLDVGGIPHDALLKITHDPGIGLLGEEIVVQRGDLLPGQTSVIDQIGHFNTSADRNRIGQIAYTVTLEPPFATDGAIYIDDTLIAQEGSPAGNTGSNWSNLYGARIDLNNHGKLAIAGHITSSGASIVYDGQLITKVGDTPPGITDGSVFIWFGGSSPVYCSDLGDVLYHGTWTNGVGPDRLGLFVNQQLLVQAGVTTIAGQTLTSFNSFYSGYRMSDNGRYIVFMGELSGGTAGLFLIDRNQIPVEFCAGDGQADSLTSAVPCPCSNNSFIGAREGCMNSQGRGAYITVDGSLSIFGGDTQFSAYQARPNQPAMLLQGSAPQKLPFKDGLLCMGNPTERIEYVFTDANGYAQTTTDIAAEGNVAPGDFRGYQLWYRDPMISVCGTGSNLSQAIVLKWL